MLEWGDDIFTAIKEAGVGQVAYVPDAGHKRLINACIADNDIKAVSLTTEEEGGAVKKSRKWSGLPRPTVPSLILDGKRR